MDSKHPGQSRQSATHRTSAFPLRPTPLSLALLAALGVFTTAPAAASCGSGSISTAVTEPCVLERNTNLVITEQGSIDVTGAAAVSIDHPSNGTNRIFNSGTLRGDQGVSIDGATVTGAAQNNAGGVIESLIGPALLVKGSTFTGNITNAGTLAAPSTEYAIRLVQSTLKGSLNNSGLAKSGITMVESQVTGDLTNSETGTIELAAIYGSTLGGSLRNAGDISSESGGLAMARTVVNKDILNSGVMGGYVGLSIVSSVVQGRVANTGLISGTAQALYMIQATLRGGLSNSGEINGYGRNVITSSTLGGLENSGTVRSSSTALLLNNVFVRGNLNNTGSFLSSNSGHAGLELIAGTVSGNLSNAGTLNGGALGYGLITSRGTEIEGDLVNSGYAIGYQAIRLNDTVIGGSLINTGRLLGGLASGQTAGQGLRMLGGSIGGDLVNRGAVQGRKDAMVLSGVHIQGQIINTGFLVSPNALRLIDTQVDGGLVNAGTIAVRKGETGYALLVDADSRLDNLYLAGDHARFEGRVYAPRTTATVYSTARYVFEAGDHWTVELVNRGTVELAAPASRTATPATLDGDYSQRSGAVLRTDVADASHYGKLVVSGTANLPSAARIDVDVTNANQPFNVTMLQDVLTAGTLKSDGTFAVTGNSALFDFGAVKDGNTVDLTLSSRASYGASMAAANAGRGELGSVARVLDAQFSQGSGSALAPYFVSASSDAEVAHGLAQTLPLDNAGLRASQAALMEISDALQQRLLPTGQGIVNYQGVAQPTLWSRPFNTLATQGRGSRSNNSGSVIGMDTQAGQGRRIGLAFAYARGDTAGDGAGANQNSRLDLWQFSGYSAYTLAPDTEFMLYAGAGHNSVAGERSLSFGGLNSDAKAEYDSLFATVGASLGHAWQVSEATRVIPALRLDYNHIRDEAYNEKGASAVAPLLLRVEGRETDQLIAGLDGRLEHAVSPGGSRLALTVGVGYDLINQDNMATASFAGAPGQRFTAVGASASPWLLRGGLSLITPLPRGAELSLNYSAQSRSDYDAQAATVQVNVPF